MKNPLDTGMRLEPFLLAQRSSARNSSPKSLDESETSETFISLMADIVEKAKITDMPGSLHLDKDCLQRLINAVTLQMNDCLLGELGDFGEGDQYASLPKLQGTWIHDYGEGNDAPSMAGSIQQEPQTAKKIISPSEFDDIIQHASNIYDVDPALITAVIKAESGFDARATSSKGAMGLMQLMPATAKELGVKNCYNPAENIMAGTRFLKSLLDRYDGNIELTLAAYNWGMGNVERQPDRLPQETRTYISRVSRFLQKGTT